jgi:hypothetical protein
MKQYLMSVYYDGSEADGLPDMDSPEIQAQYKAVDEFNQDLQRSGAWVFGGGLHVPSVATVVRAEGGEVLTTDGPFPEGKEHIGGFWIVNAPDLDAALEMAARASAACAGPVEVRPFQDEPES